MAEAHGQDLPCVKYRKNKSKPLKSIDDTLAGRRLEEYVPRGTAHRRKVAQRLPPVEVPPTRDVEAVIAQSFVQRKQFQRSTHSPGPTPSPNSKSIRFAEARAASATTSITRSRVSTEPWVALFTDINETLNEHLATVPRLCQALASILSCHDDATKIFFATHGIITSILKCVQGQPAPSLHFNACAALAHLCGVAEARAAVRNSGGITVAMRCMQKHSVDVTVQEKACLFLISMTVEKEGKTMISQEGGIPLVIKAMRKHPTVVTLQMLCCSLLAKMFWDSTSEQPLIDNCLHAAREGVCNQIVKRMFHFMTHKKFIDHATEALFYLSLNPAINCSIGLLKESGITAVIQALAKYSSHSSCNPFLWRILAEFSVWPANLGKLEQDRAPSFLLVSLQKQPSPWATPVVINMLTTLTGLCGSSNVQMLCREQPEGIKCALKLMNSNVTDPGIILNGSKFVKEISVDKTLLALILKHSVVPLLLDSLDKHSSNAPVIEAVCDALAALSESLDAKLELVNLDGLPLMLETVTKNIGNPTIIVSSCTLLTNVFALRNNRLLALKYNAIGVIRQLLHHYQGDQAVIPAVLKFVHCFGRDATCREQLDPQETFQIVLRIMKKCLSDPVVLNEAALVLRVLGIDHDVKSTAILEGTTFNMLCNASQRHETDNRLDKKALEGSMRVFSGAGIHDRIEGRFMPTLPTAFKSTLEQIASTPRRSFNTSIIGIKGNPLFKGIDINQFLNATYNEVEAKFDSYQRELLHGKHVVKYGASEGERVTCYVSGIPETTTLTKDDIIVLHIYCKDFLAEKPCPLEVSTKLNGCCYSGCEYAHSTLFGYNAELPACAPLQSQDTVYGLNALDASLESPPVKKEDAQDDGGPSMCAVCCTYYCSLNCQRRHWYEHRKHCDTSLVPTLNTAMANPSKVKPFLPLLRGIYDALGKLPPYSGMLWCTLNVGAAVFKLYERMRMAHTFVWPSFYMASTDSDSPALGPETGFVIHIGIQATESYLLTCLNLMEDGNQKVLLPAGATFTLRTRDVDRDHHEESEKIPTAVSLGIQATGYRSGRHRSLRQPPAFDPVTKKTNVMRLHLVQIPHLYQSDYIPESPELDNGMGNGKLNYKRDLVPSATTPRPNTWSPFTLPSSTSSTTLADVSEFAQK